MNQVGSTTTPQVAGGVHTRADGYVPTIGIEVHAELKTKTKMFCNSRNEPHAAKPNVHVCPICMAHPGTLPSINKEAVKHVLFVGVAIGGELATYTEFDRKNYFYPDIPKGYQISQYQYPLVKGGILAGIAITRIHLEEDTARSLHDQGSGSIVDYNRAGVPLMELVTEPVIHDAATAGRFARELQLLLRTLGVSDANMERGEMRVEANISVSKTLELGTKVEVKNLNSFKAVESAITYEIERQVDVLERGESVVQETRGWDENRSKTFTQRVKESADDYRYFPDPDLPSLHLALLPEMSLSRINEELPEVPDNKREKYSNLGLPREQVEAIVSNLDADAFFQHVITTIGYDAKELVRLAGNYVTSDLFSLTADDKISYNLKEAHYEEFVELLSMLKNGEITSRVAKDFLPEVVFGGANPHVLSKERGLLQQSSDEQLRPLVEAVLAQNKSVAEEYRGGKESVLQFLVGQGMKASKGSANPTRLAELIKEQLAKK